MRHDALAALLAVALLAGCIRGPENEVRVRNELDEPAWVTLAMSEAGSDETWFADNITLEPESDARRELPRGFGTYVVLARSSLGESANYEFKAGCGSTCFLTVTLTRDGISFSVLHGD